MSPRSILVPLALCLGLPLVARATDNFELRSTIAFASTRDNTASTEIYLCDLDGSNVRRLTATAWGEAFAALSPDGKKVVFDSGKNRPPDWPRTFFSQLFIMDADGSGQTFLLSGSSATWSPDGKNIAFHASASDTGLPINNDPGAPASDSDIFTLNVDDWLNGTAVPTNVTNTPDLIEEDADWSPDGQTLIFTSHPNTDNPTNSIHKEIYRINVDGTGLTRLTDNLADDRAPAWSPDGTKILFMSRMDGPTFELYTMNADGSNLVRLTFNSVLDATATWSPDGQKIVFHRTIGGTFQLFEMNADGTGVVQLTTPPGLNAFAHCGVVRVKMPHNAARPAQPGGAASLRLDLASSNPGHGGMNFRFLVPSSGNTRLAIYDAQGRRVATVVDQALTVGWRTASWDGRDAQGREVASGAYVAKLESGGQTQLQKVLVTR